MVLANQSMKMITKKTTSVLIVGLIFLLLAPGVSFARVGDGPTSTAPKINKTREKNPTKPGSEIFCSRLSDYLGNMERLMGSSETELKNSRATNLTRLQNRQTTADERLKDLRKRQDERMRGHFTSLEKRATTTAQKAAVAEFEQTMENALETRRSAVDAANANFRDELKTLTDKRREATETLKIAFRNSVQNATTEARNACKTSLELQTIRDNFHAALKSAKEKFAADLRELDKIKTMLGQLTHARRKAITEAEKTFLQTLKTATQKLKTAMKTTASGHSGTASSTSDSAE